MDVNSIGSSANYQGAQSAQRAPESAEVRKAGGDHDGDSDDSGATKATTTVKPSVNSSGQKTGQVINVSA